MTHGQDEVRSLPRPWVYLDTQIFIYLVRDGLGDAMLRLLETRGATLILTPLHVVELLATQFESDRSARVSLLNKLLQRGVVVDGWRSQVRAMVRTFAVDEPCHITAGLDAFEVEQLLLQIEDTRPETFEAQVQQNRLGKATWADAHSAAKTAIEAGAYDVNRDESASEFLARELGGEFAKSLLAGILTTDLDGRITARWDHLLDQVPLFAAFLELPLLEVLQVAIARNGRSAKGAPDLSDLRHASWCGVVDDFVTNDDRLRELMQWRAESKADVHPCKLLDWSTLEGQLRAFNA